LKQGLLACDRTPYEPYVTLVSKANHEAVQLIES
jgi:hypothetical protein